MKKRDWLAGGLSCLACLSQSLPAWANSPVTLSSQDRAGEPATFPVAVPAIAPQNLDRASLDRASLDRDASIDPDTSPDAMAEVRSVDELSDVRPTDWAYQALRTLIERYGVLTGFPDGTFRGDRPLSRYEFAAALNQVLTRVDQQLASGQINNQLREDFATLRRLQATYGQIATSLRQRLDSLDQQLTTLSQQQFATTSKLSGQTVLALTDGTDAGATVLSRVRLNLSTSFSGQDLLLTQLEAGNAGLDAVNRAQTHPQDLLGTTGLLADGGGLDYVEVPSAVRLSKLYYTFRPLADLSVTVGPRLAPRDFIDYNRFANESTANFSSSFFTNNPLTVQGQVDRPGGAGVVLQWRPENLPLTLRALYAAADAAQPNSSAIEGGLFGDRNQGSVELQYDFSKELTARLQYTHATINNTDISAAGLNVEWALNQAFGVFGRVGIGKYKGFNSALNQDLDLKPWTWSVGFIARRIVIPGSTAGVAIGQPFVEGDLGNATQTNIEAFYSFLLNDSISFTPALLVVTNPNNDRNNGTIWEWMVRMVFSF